MLVVAVVSVGCQTRSLSDTPHIVLGTGEGRLQCGSVALVVSVRDDGAL